MRHACGTQGHQTSPSRFTTRGHVHSTRRQHTLAACSMCSIATWHSRRFASYWLVAQLTGSSDRTSSCSVVLQGLQRTPHSHAAHIQGLELNRVLSANVCSLSRNIATLHNPHYTLRLHAGICSHYGTLIICRITGELSPLAAHDLTLCSATHGLASNAHNTTCTHLVAYTWNSRVSKLGAVLIRDKVGG